MKEKIKEWVWRIIGADAQIKQWTDTAIKLSSQMTDLRAIIFQKDDEIEALKAEPAKLKAEIEKLKDERDKALEKARTMDDLVARRNQLQGKCDSLDVENDCYMEKYHEDKREWRHKLDIANGKLGAMTTKYNKLVESYHKLMEAFTKDA